MKLEDLIDLEAQIAADEGRDGDSLRARDRDLFQQLRPEAATGDRHALLAGWLEALRRRGSGPALGHQVATGYRLSSYLLVLSGLALGWGTAAFLLRFEEGGAPVNVGYFLGVVVGAQLLLLALLLGGLPLARVFPELPVVSDLRALLRWLGNLLQRLALRAEERLSAEQRERWRVGRARLRTRASLYPAVEQWLLVGLAQTFGVAFNLGVLGCCLQLVLFSDLAFSWSTTVESVDAAWVQGLTSWLGLPWGWAFPDAVPSLQLVEQTQYFRLDGRFAGAAAGVKGDPQLVRGWWRFLIAAAVVYGLLPRAAMWTVARVLRERALASLPLDTADVDRIVRRLRAPQLTTRPAQLVPQKAEPARALPAPALAESPPGGGSAVAPAPAPAPGAPSAASPAAPATRSAVPACALVRWRGVPLTEAAVARAVEQNFGCAVGESHSAGGLDFAADQELCARLAAGDERILVLAEGWEAPDKSIRRFLARLRAAAGPRRKLLVALVGESEAERWSPVDPDELRIWRDRLTLLQDPYLGVEPLEAAA